MKLSFSWLKQPSLYGMLAIVALGSLFPFYWMYVIGSSDNSAIASIPPTVVPGNNWGETFAHITEMFDLWTVYRNSFVVAAVTAIAAYALPLKLNIVLAIGVAVVLSMTLERFQSKREGQTA